MTRTIITLLITVYSLARLVALAALYYYNIMRLPTGVVVVTVLCCTAMLMITGTCYLRQLSGKNLRFALFLCAAAACANMLMTLLAQPGALSNVELLVTGTVFDIFFFLGSCTIKIRDTKGGTGNTPFTRSAAATSRAKQH